MKLSSKIHGLVDYLVAIFLWIAPSLFNLPTNTTTVVYGLGLIHLALTAFTNFEYGLIRFIPLKIHGWIELAASVLILGVAFYLGSLEGEYARNFLIGVSVSVFVLWVLSDYTNKPKGTQEIPYIESNTDGNMI